MLLVAAAPTVIGGTQAVLLSRQALEERIREMLEKTSQAQAEIIGNIVNHQRQTLTLAAANLSATTEDREQIAEQLRGIYMLSDNYNAVGLFDSSGRQLGPLIFNNERRAAPAVFRFHEQVAGSDLEHFRQVAIRLARQCNRTGSGELYWSPRRAAASLPLVLPLHASQARLCLVVELSLAEIQKRVEHLHVGRRGFVMVVDDRGRLVAHPDRRQARSRRDLSHLSLLKGHLGTTSPAVGSFVIAGYGTMLGAFSPVPHSPWAVVVAQPVEEALQPVRQLGWRLGGWLVLSLLVAVLTGMVLARRITRPIQSLVREAKEIGRGNLAARIHYTGSDEIGNLGSSFNSMGEQLQRQRAQIESQTEEIRRWNLELQRRVEERTRELRQTQEQLVQAQKMAAAGELGAGLAHEVNNPLLGVLGCAQLLLMRHPPGDPDHQMLADIEQQAQRIRLLISRLLEASQGGGRGRGRLYIGKLLEKVLDEHAPELQRHSVAVELQLADDLPPLLGRSVDLERAIGELIDNACQALASGGRLRLSATGQEGKVVTLVVEDDGPGIAPENLDRIFEPFFTTRHHQRSQGLGLADVYRVISDHDGKIEVQSEPGRFTRFIIRLPAARRETHLR